MEQTKPNVVNLTINGKKLQAKAGQTVFEAAAEAGIFIPHYCYHPDLSIAGVCRMCLCEVEKAPKLQISCNTTVAEGMVVRTDTPKVKDTVKGVLELHLINHPLDCPICDKAGECKLQDFYAQFGLYESEMEYEKVHKPKVVDIGTIVLDSERCILCSRCVRFTAEVTETNELGIFNRGDRSELRTYDHGPLKNDYTGNLADICPVGALTAKDFRFKQRVWFLDKSDTVCTLCAHGCNTTTSVNPSTKKLFRVEPRRNPEVNKSWMCDTGRWEFHYVADDTRITTPKRYVDGRWQEVAWHEALSVVAEDIEQNPDRVLVALSTFMTNEEIADAVTSLSGMGVRAFTRICDEAVVDDRKPYDGLLKHHDETPNVLGFEAVIKAMGHTWLKPTERKARLQANAFDRVIVVGLEGKKMPGLSVFLQEVPKLTRVALHATSMSSLYERVDTLFPAVSSYEKHGTVISALGRLQKVNGVLPFQYTGRDAHSLVFGLVQRGDREAVPAGRAQHYFESVVVDKILLGTGEKWRTFRTGGISLTEAHRNANVHA